MIYNLQSTLIKSLRVGGNMDDGHQVPQKLNVFFFIKLFNKFQ